MDSELYATIKVLHVEVSFKLQYLTYNSIGYVSYTSYNVMFTIFPLHRCIKKMKKRTITVKLWHPSKSLVQISEFHIPCMEFSFRKMWIYFAFIVKIRGFTNNYWMLYYSMVKIKWPGVLCYT